MFFKKKKSKEYDHTRYEPIIRASICNGEQVAGLKDLRTGEFQEEMLIRNEKDLEEFKTLYGVRSVRKEY